MTHAASHRFVSSSSAHCARARAVAIGLACSTLLAGCHGATLVREPSTEIPGHVVLVNPLTMDTGGVQSGLATSEELTSLLIERLHGYGIQAVDHHTSAVTETLLCSVPQLGYTIRRRYPRRLHYKAALTCSLVEPNTHASVWERKLDQHYDEAVVFNTMTKLPEHHDPIVWRECIEPVWDGMASGLRMYFERPPLVRSAVPPPATDRAPMEEPKSPEFFK